MKRHFHHRPSDDEAIESTAAAWLAQHDDSMTPAQAAAFACWRAADPRHEAAVARLDAAWIALQQLREFRPEAQRHPDRDLLCAPSLSRRVSRFPAIPAMAALAASLVLAMTWWFSLAQRGGEVRAQNYSTTTNGYERISLEDGSIVELNAESEILVRFTPVERRVRLVRGEAHFTVTKNKVRPFWVEAGPVAVRAVGTAFNVRLGSGDIEVLVSEGKVAVTRGRVDPYTLLANGDLEQTRSGQHSLLSPALVTANERIVTTAVTADQLSAPLVVEKLAPDAVREALAWQGPRLVFVDTPLADVIMQFNHHNYVQLVLADAELGALPIGGSFRAENVDAFVRLLASDKSILIDRSEPNRIVIHRVRASPKS